MKPYTLFLIAIVGISACASPTAPTVQTSVCTGFKDGIRPDGYETMTWEEQSKYVVKIPIRNSHGVTTTAKRTTPVTPDERNQNCAGATR
jgi:hypothetical protein